MSESCAIILAAGEGKRMKSDQPKVMLNVLFKPMIRWVIDSVISSGTTDICAVVGFKEEIIKNYLGEICETVSQYERKGTGHAVMQARNFLERHMGGHVLILCGDAPFMDAKTIRAAFDKHIAEKNAVTIISANLENPEGYGRVVRDEGIGPVIEIVEHGDANEEQLAIKEVNSGAYWFKIDKLLPILNTENMHNNNAQGEYYLPEAIKIFLEKGFRVNAYLTDNSESVMGANSCLQLNALSSIVRKKILENLLESGVEMPCSEGVIIGPDVEISNNVTILPGTILRGKTIVGSGCTVGPNSLIDNCVIGDNCNINASQCYLSNIGGNVDIGPFSHIRFGCDIANGVHIGDYVELKNSKIGEDSKISHLSYIGDSDFGKRINVGCGCVTANYDGKVKNKCIVEDDVFIGCHTNMIAPVVIKRGSYIAAGTTITEDIPEDSFVIGRSRQEIKENRNKNENR